MHGRSPKANHPPVSHLCMPDIDVGQSGAGASAVQSRPFKMISAVALPCMHSVPCTGRLAQGALHTAKCANFVHSANVLTLQTVQTLTTEKTRTAKSQSQRQININILLRDDQWLYLARGKMCKFCTSINVHILNTVKMLTTVQSAKV